MELGIIAFTNKFQVPGTCPAPSPVPLDSCDTFAGHRELVEAACAILLGATFQVPVAPSHLDAGIAGTVG